MTTQELLPIVAEQKEEFLSDDFASFCPREEEIQIDLKSHLAQVVIGVRRSGKSTMCRKVLREANVKAAYINFDDERLAKTQTSDLNNILEALYIVYGDFQYLFLDEAFDGLDPLARLAVKRALINLVSKQNTTIIDNPINECYNDPQIVKTGRQFVNDFSDFLKNNENNDYHPYIKDPSLNELIKYF